MNKNELVTVQDLQELKEEIISKIEHITKNKTTQKEWLRSFEVMEMLGISTGTLQNLRINGNISYTRMGGTLFYKRADIIATLNNNAA